MMDARLQRRIQRYGWDKAAAWYEQSWQRQLAPAQTTMLALAELAPGERVVDVACGTGLVTFAAAEAVGPTGVVVGTDLSEAMVTLAAARARSRGSRHVSFARMDAEDLSPLEDASFDVALCGLGLDVRPRSAESRPRDDPPRHARVIMVSTLRIGSYFRSYFRGLSLSGRTRRRRRLGTA